MGLPLISSETAKAVQGEVHDRKNFYDEEMRRMIKENPRIAHLITMMSNGSSDAKTIIACSLIICRLLEVQAEAEVEKPTGYVN